MGHAKARAMPHLAPPDHVDAAKVPAAQRRLMLDAARVPALLPGRVERRHESGGASK
jgi:hypothetical protein